jgi:hypothetical protein
MSIWFKVAIVAYIVAVVFKVYAANVSPFSAKREYLLAGAGLLVLIAIVATVGGVVTL